MASHLISLSQYNLWANIKMGQFINEAGERAADDVLISSFPTIRKTLYHLWDAQEIWLKRLKGESTKGWPSQNFTGTLSESIDLMLESSAEFVRFTENIPELEHIAPIKFHSIDGTAYQNTIEEIIMHVMNHGTYHRGQLITMLRNAGFQNVSSTDMIRFFRE